MISSKYFPLIMSMNNNSFPSCAYPVQGLEAQIGTYYTTTSFNPIYGLYNYSISGNLYSGASVGAKQLTGLSVYFSGYTTPYSYINQELWIGVVSNSTFPTTTPQVDFSDLTFITPLTKVKSSFTLNITNNTWHQFNFDTNFCYDGANNLLLVWKNYDASWQSGYGNAQVANVVSKAMYKGQDASFPTTGTGTRTNFPLLIKFNY